MFMLWVLFVGALASGRWEEREWFVQELELISQQLGIRNLGEMRGFLRRVVWQEEFCGEPCARLWDEINFLWDVQDYPALEL